MQVIVYQDKKGQHSLTLWPPPVQPTPYYPGNCRPVFVEGVALYYLVKIRLRQ